MVYIYLEHYFEAYNDLMIAHNIDKSLKADVHTDNINTMIINVNKLIKFQVNM